MKKINKITKTIELLIALIIIVGIVVALIVGFKFDLKYQDTKKVQLYIGKSFEVKDIKQITDEVMQKQDVIIQKVEVYEDTVSIIAKDITDEQKANLINKINEKYEIELSADSTEITTIPNTRGRDIIRPYITPFIIATIIILVYLAIRYHNLGIIKTILKTVFIIILMQVILLSIMAIVRIPIGKLTIPIVLTVYILTVVGINVGLAKKLNKKEDE